MIDDKTKQSLSNDGALLYKVIWIDDALSAIYDNVSTSCTDECLVRFTMVWGDVAVVHSASVLELVFHQDPDIAIYGILETFNRYISDNLFTRLAVLIEGER